MSCTFIQDSKVILGCAAAEAYCYDRGCFFFFTRIGSRPYQNSGKYRRVFLFHQNWFATIPKFREIQEGLSFHQNWFATIPKLREIQEGLSFSPESIEKEKHFAKRCFLFKKVFPFQKDVSFSKGNAF